MKCHAGVDAGTGYIHSIEATAANVYDITLASKLIRADDEVAYGDAGIWVLTSGHKSQEMCTSRKLITVLRSAQGRSGAWRRALPGTNGTAA